MTVSIPKPAKMARATLWLAGDMALMTGQVGTIFRAIGDVAGFGEE